MMQSFLNIDDRRRIYKSLSSAKVFDEMQRLHTLVKFLDAIFNLHQSPSNDSRFNTLYQSFTRHLIDNYDYDIDEVIIDRLHLLRDDNGEIFKRFIIALLDQSYYESEGELDSELFNKVLSILKTHLRPLGWEYVVFSHDENGNVRYKLKELTLDHTDKIPPNSIPIILETSVCNSSYYYNHEAPNSGNVLLLVFDLGWTDYDVATKATLFYYDNNLKRHDIGNVKILYMDDHTVEMGGTDRYCTKDYIKENTFYSFGPNFCSLGQTSEYYSNISNLFSKKDEWQSILLAMRDCAYFSSIYEQFSSAPQWHSLIRNLSAESMLQLARPLMHGANLDNVYNFSYRFIPPYSVDDEEVKIDFIFDNPPMKKEEWWIKGKRAPSILNKRIYGIIGKNGVGKTHFLTSIPSDIATGKLTSFYGQMPLFRKVVTVSNSYYDHFDIPEPSLDFNYVYCGHLKLSENVGDRWKKELKSQDEFTEEIIGNCKKITSLLKAESLKKLLKDLLPFSFLEKCFENRNHRLEIANVNILKSEIDKLSSGEASLLHIFVSLVANVGPGTLILFDEPETHLHPNAITSLFNSLQILCEETNSYAIIATHSPLVIREIRSECVFVFSRSENICNVSKINYESFGASIDYLAEDIFGNREVSKSYLRIIKDLVDDYNKSEDEIIRALSNGQLPLGLGVRLYIHHLINQKNNEESDSL